MRQTLSIPVFDYPRQSTQAWERLSHAPTEDPSTQRAVKRIIDQVRGGGDKALIAFTRKFDRVLLTPETLRVPTGALVAAWRAQTEEVRDALKLAAQRIRAFHERQVPKSWEMTDDAGFRLGQRWRPLGAVGLYVPGGTAAYPSTVLMNAIPAKVAGVKRIVAVTPPPRDGKFTAATFAALHLAGVDEVYQVGGAQAIAALACGTDSIPRVDKIVGPGNKYVAEAKRLLYGTIDIDMVAGPSEVMIIADESAKLEWIAADMLAQAEHDPDAQAVAILVGRRDGKALAKEIARQVKDAPRKSILTASLNSVGTILHTSQLETAVEIANRKAPEHLELMLKSARRVADQITNAGSIFIGHHAAEAIGDYIAGPNHVLPTGGTARFFSPLSVLDFFRMTQTIETTRDGLRAVGPQAANLAAAEGLDAHRQSILCRLRD